MILSWRLGSTERFEFGGRRGRLASFILSRYLAMHLTFTESMSHLCIRACVSDLLSKDSFEGGVTERLERALFHFPLQIIHTKIRYIFYTFFSTIPDPLFPDPTVFEATGWIRLSAIDAPRRNMEPHGVRRGGCIHSRPQHKKK